MTMAYDTAIHRLRSQVKQLACAAASQCLRDRLERSSVDHPLMELDQLAKQLAAPALEALSVIAGELQAWPDPPADENATKKSIRSKHTSTSRVIQRTKEK